MVEDSATKLINGAGIGAPFAASRLHEPPARGRRRVRLLLGLTALLAVVAIVLGSLFVVNYRRADRWADRSADWEARAVASEQRESGLRGQLEQSQAESGLRKIALEKSEEDRTALQVRIDDLAGEKASAEDGRRLAEGERDSAIYVSNLAGAAAVDARQCLADVGTALSAIVDYYAYNPAYIDSLVDIAVASCNRSDASYARFANAVGSLP